MIKGMVVRTEENYDNREEFIGGSLKWSLRQMWCSKKRQVAEKGRSGIRRVDSYKKNVIESGGGACRRVCVCVSIYLCIYLRTSPVPKSVATSEQERFLCKCIEERCDVFVNHWDLYTSDSPHTPCLPLHYIPIFSMQEG